MTGTGYTLTRSQLVDALAAIEIRPVLLHGRAAVNAENMADAILSQLPPSRRDSLVTVATADVWLAIGALRAAAHGAGPSPLADLADRLAAAAGATS